MELKLLTNHKLIGTRTAIGRSLENEATPLIISIPNELINFEIYLEFETRKNTYSTSALEVDENNIIKYLILNSLLEDDILKVQVVARKEDVVWKSEIISFDVNGSINADQEYSIKYPNFINEVQEKLDECITIAKSKQNKLYSGVNIKTINGESILGEGNINIEGGGGGDLTNYYTKEETNELLDGKANIGEIPTKTSQLTNDSDYTTNASLTNGLSSKVDKVVGKGLSTNDYTNNDKAIVDSVTTNLNTKANKDDVYTKTETNDTFATKQYVQEAEQRKKATYVVDTYNDIATYFSTKKVGDYEYSLYIGDKRVELGSNILIKDIGIPDYWVSSVTSSLNDIYSFLSPLETTKVDLSNYYTKDDTDSLLDNKVDKDGEKVLSTNDYTNTDKAIVDNVTANLDTKANKSELSAVATSGSYNDLLNKPTIPSKTSQLTNDSGYQNATQVQALIDTAIANITNGDEVSY